VIPSPYGAVPTLDSLEIDAMFDKTEKPLRFLQIGDLHITDAGLQNHADLRCIVDEVNGNIGEHIDFVYLPGDNADDGTPEQFRIVHDELSRLIAPWHAIPGDHDFKPDRSTTSMVAFTSESCPTSSRYPVAAASFSMSYRAATAVRTSGSAPRAWSGCAASLPKRDATARRRWCSCTPIPPISARRPPKSLLCSTTAPPRS
jgi:predicted MPP superfamily phosphohydrolase